MARFVVSMLETYDMDCLYDYIVEANSESEALSKIADGEYISSEMVREDVGDMIDSEVQNIELYTEDTTEEEIFKAQIDGLIDWYFKFSSMSLLSTNNFAYNIEKITLGNTKYAIMEIFDSVENLDKGKFSIYKIGEEESVVFNNIPNSWLLLTDKETFEILKILKLIYQSETKIITHEEPYGLYYDLVNTNYHKGTITFGYLVDENGIAKYWDDSLNLPFPNRLMVAADVYDYDKVQKMNTKSLIYANAVIESYRKETLDNND